MNVSVPRPDPAALEAAGSEHLAARRFEAAAEAFDGAAELVERPGPELMLKLARAQLEAGRPGAAAARLFGIVDGGAGFRIWAAAGGASRPLPGRQLARGALPAAGRAGRHLDHQHLRAAAPARRRPARHRARRSTSRTFGQYFNATLDPGSALLAAAPEVLVLAPDHRALGFRAFSDTPAEDVAAELDRWSGVWEAVRRAAAPVIVQLGFAAPGGDPLGHHGAGVPGARRSMTLGLNAGLAARAAAADVGFVDVGRGSPPGPGRRPGSTRAAGTWRRSPTARRRCRSWPATPPRSSRRGSGCRAARWCSTSTTRSGAG